jgi:hypothetical protein
MTPNTPADVASLPAKWREEVRQHDQQPSLSYADICTRDTLRTCADELEAALTPAGEGGLPELPTFGFCMSKSGAHVSGETADQMRAYANEARRLATTEQPGSSVQGEACGAPRDGRACYPECDCETESDCAYGTEPRTCGTCNEAIRPDVLTGTTCKCATQPEARGVEGIVLAEVERATAKFPTWPTDPLHAVAVLGEEFGELTKAVLQSVYEPHKNPPGAVRTEALQTAAMALRFLASVDRYEGARCPQHKQGEQ